MRTIGVLCGICCGIFTSIANADSWVGAQPTVYVSADGFYTGLVIPGTKDSPCQLFVYRETESNPNAKPGKIEGWAELRQIQMQPGESWADYRKRQLDQWQKDPARQLLWNVKLENEVAPVDVFVSDGGQYVVTLDNWHRVGYGDEVVAFFHKDGLIKKYDLETIIPLTKETKADSQAGDFVKLTMPGYFGLFSHSASSRWWRRNGAELMTSIDGKSLFGVWLSWKRNWIIWDVQTGQQLTDPSELLGRFNQLVRKQILENLDPQRSQIDACKNPEDRKRIEKMLTDEHFSTGTRSRNDILEFLQAKSYLRCTADMALAIWDGKLDDFVDCWDYDFRYLGSCKGMLMLPEIPKNDQTLYIYLIPQNVPEDQLQKQPFLQLLSVTFDKYTTCDASKIPFKIFGITPGSYYIKAIYRTSMKEKHYRSSADEVYTGQKGDYINKDKVTIDVHAGKLIQKDIICDHEIK
jgi:hypothetical protein